MNGGESEIHARSEESTQVPGVPVARRLPGYHRCFYSLVREEAWAAAETGIRPTDCMWGGNVGWEAGIRTRTRCANAEAILRSPVTVGVERDYALPGRAIYNKP